MKRNNNVRVLIIDDSEADIYLMKNIIFTDFCGKLDSVKDGIEALAYLYNKDSFAASSLPNLIIMDLNLPGLNGKELLGKIKANKNFNSIPVVMFSTSSNENDINECYRMGASCYLIKPFNLDEYENIINSIKKYWMETVTLPEENEYLFLNSD